MKQTQNVCCEETTRTGELIVSIDSSSVSPNFVKFFRLHSIAQRRRNLSLANKEKVITFNSCKEFYSSKAKSKLFNKCKPQGIQVQVKYIDTHGQTNKTKATVLALHGAPGSYQDFEGIIEQLTQQGCRVIAPNLPDIKLTHQTQMYYHSTEEKYEILRDFLHQIGAPSIDVAIMHSAGVYCGMKLWYERPEFIRSLVLLNPSGHRTCKGMRPEVLVALLARMNLSRFGRLLWQRFGVTVVSLLGHAAKISEEESDGSLTSLLGMYMAGVERLEVYLKHLATRSTPTIMVYSDKDRLIELDIYLELLQMLGATKDNVNLVSAETGDIQKGK